MWLKNIRVYTLNQPFDYDCNKLENLLSSQSFTPCSGQDVAKIGWTNVLDNPEAVSLCHKIGDDYFFKCRIEKKVLPTSVVNELLEERIEELETTQCRQLKKKEKSDLKEDVIAQLLPKAFVTHKEYWVWINAKYKYVILNATSNKLCDDLLSLLKKSLGSLEVKPFTFNKEIHECFTSWINEKPPVGIELGDETVLEELEGAGGTIRAKKQDLLGNEIKVHLDAGKVVTSLALTVNDDISFIIDTNFNIKRIRLSDTIVDENKTVSDDPAAILDADLTLMAGEYCKVIPILIDAFGGEADI
ncbi:MAG: recombination-associated protein RdgC [Succinivibrionaceae bacterium]